MSSEQVGRLELALRMRSRALSRGAGPHERCPACGGPIAPGDDRLLVAGVAVHGGCVPARPKSP
jgi:hypothetical protein